MNYFKAELPKQYAFIKLLDILSYSSISNIIQIRTYTHWEIKNQNRPQENSAFSSLSFNNRLPSQPTIRSNYLANNILSLCLYVFMFMKFCQFLPCHLCMLISQCGISCLLSLKLPKQHGWKNYCAQSKQSFAKNVYQVQLSGFRNLSYREI